MSLYSLFTSPSQSFVLSEIIDKFACACQAVIIMKTLGNLVLFIWSKFRITANLAAENLALRQQLAIMKRTSKRPKIRMKDRLFWVLLSRIWSSWREALVIAKPDTVVHWHRKGFKLFWKFKSKGPGRPQVSREIRDLVRRMAVDNPNWGAPRIHGELLRLGFEVSERTNNCEGQVSPSYAGPMNSDLGLRSRDALYNQNNQTGKYAMPIINSPKNTTNEPPFFSDIKEDGYHIYSLNNAKTPNFYPPELPDYPGVPLRDLKKDDTITIRVFFGLGKGKKMRVDGGHVDLRVEFVDKDKVLAVITTQLPKEFPLRAGDSLEVFEEEILYGGKTI